MIEVIVAMGIFLVVMAAVFPQVMAGIRGTSRASQLTEAKGVIEAQLELMRNLPWHVAPDAGDYIDVLDRYYPDLGVAATTVTTATCAGLPDDTSWTGYVKATSARCPEYETTSGAFFRTVEVVDPAGPG